MSKHIAIALFIGIVALSVVVADPLGVTNIDRGISERGQTTASTSQRAEAGNLTSISINGPSITQRWQGYFGNVSGGISLEDAAGNSLYDWDLVNPSGEIFAVNHSAVTWDSIFCVNFSAPASLERLNGTNLNRFIGYTSNEDLAKSDSVNATFNQTLGDSGETLTVGSVSFNNADNCSMVTLNTATGYQTSVFREVLLTDNVSIIFTSILENNGNGFNGVSTDFEIIVGVNGTEQYTTRDYFFFVEIS